MWCREYHRVFQQLSQRYIIPRTPWINMMLHNENYLYNIFGTCRCWKNCCKLQNYIQKVEHLNKKT